MSEGGQKSAIDLWYVRLLEIVDRVKYKDGDVPFRPRLSELGKSPKVVTDLIKECWDDDPHKRPDFKLIRSRLKPLQKGM